MRRTASAASEGTPSLEPLETAEDPEADAIVPECAQEPEAAEDNEAFSNLVSLAKENAA